MMAHIVTPSDYIHPRVVSLKELRDKLMPFIRGWGWADDAINDLWKLGAPDPQASLCPCKPPCPVRECPHVRRVLMPRQFAAWWGEVGARIGSALTAEQALRRARVR